MHLLKQPTSLDTHNASLPFIPHSIQTHIQYKILWVHYHQCYKLLKDYGMEFIAGIMLTADEKKAIEGNTHLQASTAQWYEEHHCRSNFGHVVLHQSGF